MMQQLIYISTASKTLNDRQVSEMLARSRGNNSRTGVTGLLVYHRGRFLQALEGPVAAVR